MKEILGRSAAALLPALATAAFSIPAGCEAKRGPSPAAPGGVQAPRSSGIELPRAEPRLCTAVAILLDASTSMSHPVRGSDGAERPKHEIAREALERIIDRTAAHVKKHPDLSLQLGILRFSSSIEEILPMAPFEPEAARAALRQVRASSGTAIGRALAGGFKALRATGCVRQHLICITDGENSSGPSPGPIARDLYRETQGAVGIHFVAFDTSARRFGFLGDVGGSAIEAADGAELEVCLTEIYSKRILAEAMPGE